MKSRDLGLDIIRITAVGIILLVHFSAIYVPSFDASYYGCIGSTLFFILSGYVIQLNSKYNIDIKSFFKKRFLALFPIFWITFILAYFFHTLLIGNFFYGGNPWKIIYTIFGVDSYLGLLGYADSYYLVGEWFTTIIILIYLIYPILNIFFKYRFKSTLIIIYSFYVIFSFYPLFIFKNSEDASIFTGLAMFLTGMIIEKYKNKLRRSKLVLIGCPILAIILAITKLPEYSLLFRNLLGCCLFLIIFSMTRSLKGKGTLAKTVVFLSSISYSVYLTHHFIANELKTYFFDHFNIQYIPVFVFIGYIIFTIIISVLIIIITESILIVLGIRK